MTKTNIPPAVPIPLSNANLLAFAYTMGLFPPIPLYYPSSEATLVHFFTHLSHTVSYGTIKFTWQQ